MSYVVLARKWRPMAFSDLVGQDHVAATLGNAIKSGRVAHAFLFTGVRGVGKTTSARIMAKALNCLESDGPTATPCLKCAACKEIAEGSDMDVQEIDGASYNGVDEVRRLQESMPYAPTRDRYKIYIVDEVHMLSQSAWNAFLKTLEEPPPHVKFIFATTEVHKVPITILSRVQRFDFKLIPTRLIMQRLRYVLAEEKIEAEEAALAIIAREAAGSMRDAMSLLDQVIAWGDEKLTEQAVTSVLGVASRKVLYDVTANLIAAECSPLLASIDDLANQGFDISNVARDLLGVLRDVVVNASSDSPEQLLDLPDDERDQVKALAQHPVDDLLRLHQGFSHSYDDVVRSSQPRAALEMLLVRLARRPPLVPIDDLIERLIRLEKRLHGAPRSGGGGRAPAAAPPRSGGAPPRPPANQASSGATVRAATDSSAHPTDRTSKPATPAARAPGGDSVAGDTRPAASADEPPVARSPAVRSEATISSNSAPATQPAPASPRPRPAPDEASTHAAASPGRANAGTRPATEDSTEEEPAPHATPAPAPERVTEQTGTSSSKGPAADVAPAADVGPAADVAPVRASSAAPGPTEPSAQSDKSATPARSAPTPQDEAPASAPPSLVDWDECSDVERWRLVVDRLRDEEPKLGAFLDHADVVEATRRKLHLRYQPGSVVDVALQEKSTLGLIRQAAQSLLGRAPEIVTEVAAAAVNGQSVFAVDKQARLDSEQAALQEARNHPVLLEAVRVLGARVKNIELPKD